ncbi:TetR/AcrR family transcriptional regulator [Patulibacter defluvii]|uniref:TetR/AcrR family transcriptional regulator n=1 Tax=Patulibacter defluvii TaxID=3095358 RepID=UPI002A750648|nr:helix-turn-helix domain-containing protein [Patulibacter sp. DM4]
MDRDRRYPARIVELLDAAVRAFAVGGYSGTSTAQVAREAGVSQPYIMRVFGTKEQLFIDTHQHAGAMIHAAFAEAGERAGGFDPVAIGQAYRDLVLTQREALLIFAHGFSASGHPRIAAEARRLMAQLHHLLCGLGASEAQLRDFIGRGMLINNILLAGVPEHAEDLGLQGFLLATFGEE